MELTAALLPVILTRSDNQWVTAGEWHLPNVPLTVDLVILTLCRTSLQVLLVEGAGEPYAGVMMALSGGFLRNAEEPILVAGHRELSEEAGLDADALLLEQFGVYADPGRDPRGQVVSMVFLAIAPRSPDSVSVASSSTPRSPPPSAGLPSPFRSCGRPTRRSGASVSSRNFCRKIQAPATSSSRRPPADDPARQSPTPSASK